MMVEIISFDLDGTLVSEKFADAVWFKEIPRLYSEKFGLPLKTTIRKIKEEYEAVGDAKPEWYDIKFWIKKFKLGVGYLQIFRRCLPALTLYPEAISALKKLEKKYELILITNAAREFLDFELKHLKIGKFFTHTFSSISDLGVTRKNSALYTKIVHICKTDPRDILHVGDHFIYDYLEAKRAGLKSLYLDRKGKRRGPETIKNLTEVGRLLEKL